MGERAQETEAAARLRAQAAEIAALREERDRLAATAAGWERLLMSSPVGMAVYNPDGSLKTSNAHMKRMFGISEEEHEWLLANYNILEDEQQHQAGVHDLLHRAFEGERVTLPVVRYVAPPDVDIEQAPHWLQASFAPIRDEEGAIQEVILALLDVSDIEQARRAMEAQGRELAQRLGEVEGLYATSPVGLCLVDTNLRFVRINDQMAKINGASVADHLGRTLREILPQLADRLEPLYRRVIATGKPVTDVEVTGSTQAMPCGVRHWIASHHPVRTPEGSTWGVSVAVQDITAVKRAAQALEESEERFRELADNVRDVFWLFDRVQRRVIYVSPAYEEIMGCLVEDLYADPGEWARSVHPEDRAQARDSLSRIGQSPRGSVREYRIVRPDGEVRWIADRTFPIRDENGDVVRIAGIAEDVTHRRLAEEALRTSEEHLRTLVSHAPAALWATDCDGRFTLSEGKALAAIGVRPGEIDGRSVFDVFADHPHICDFVRRALAGETVEEKPRIGDAVFDARYVPRRAADGSIIGTFGVAIDVTEGEQAAIERRRLHDRIQEAQRLESLGILAGGIAHDFNNLLMGVLGNADLALARIPAGTPGREYIAQIETTALRAAELTNQMLAYSGRGRFLVEPIDLNRLVEEMRDLLRTVISKKATLQLDLAPELPAVEADASQIRQIVMNLITNASEALEDEPGVIVVHTDARHVEEAALADCICEPGTSKGRYVVLRVSDTGAGFDTETRRRIFDPFFTTKFAGRGLGLSGVLGIIRGHRGAVRVHSTPGRGTTFDVLFPASDLQAVSAPEEDGAEELPDTDGHVLVVDDDEVVLDVVRMMLTGAGYSVILARDGQQGVDRFREHADEIAVVLLDMTMPCLSGEEAFREMQAIRSDIPVLLSSGYSEQEARSHFPGEGLAGFVQKPYRSRDLLESLRSVLSGPRARGGSAAASPRETDAGGASQSP